MTMTSAIRDDELLIERIFDAPRELVFRVWTTPEHLMRWWGPKDYRAIAYEMDFRPGGAYRSCIEAPDGARSWMSGVYQEIVAPERIVMTFGWDADRILGAHILGPQASEMIHEICVAMEFGAAAQDVIVVDLHTGAGPYAYPALLSVAVEDHAGLDWGRALFGPAMSVVLTGEGRTTDTGIAATATGYVSDAVRKAMPQARVLPLVIECGTLPGEQVNNSVREDNWLHLYADPLSPQGQQIKDRLRHAFVPADPDWQAQVLAASLAYFDRALTDLERQGGNAPRLAVAKPVARAPESGQPAVEVRDLHKSYGPLEVLKGVDLVAQPGEVVSMIGSSGSGKSTFLRCINLLEQPKSGRIVIDGEEIRMKPGRDGITLPADQKQVERIRARVGMVFQSFNLWPHLSVLDNITEAPIHVLKESRAEAIDRAHELLKKVGLSEKHAHFPGQLSGGQQQRAAIARTLAMRPKVILLDEPTSALDPELVGEVLRVIRQLAEEGNTMILVTHEMQFAREVSHHIKFLHQGRVEEEGAPDQIFTNPRSERLSQFLARCN